MEQARKRRRMRNTAQLDGGLNHYRTEYEDVNEHPCT
jgi:hypothetical protein